MFVLPFPMLPKISFSCMQVMYYYVHSTCLHANVLARTGQTITFFCSTDSLPSESLYTKVQECRQGCYEKTPPSSINRPMRNSGQTGKNIRIYNFKQHNCSQTTFLYLPGLLEYSYTLYYKPVTQHLLTSACVSCQVHQPGTRLSSLALLIQSHPSRYVKSTALTIRHIFIQPHKANLFHLTFSFAAQGQSFQQIGLKSSKFQFIFPTGL